MLSWGLVCHSFSAFLSLQVLVLIGYQGSGLKASLMSEDSTYSCKVLHPLLICTNMNKVRTAITEKRSPSCQKKALFEKIKWGSCWLFAQSSTTRRGLLKERDHSGYASFHELPPGSRSMRARGNMSQQQMWCPELHWRRCRDYISHAWSQLFAGCNFRSKS